MKELVILSGKGGTGKTSITASFAAISSEKVLCDADVDAADLHLLLLPEIRQRTDFQGGGLAVIDPQKCSGCFTCVQACRFDAVKENFEIDEIACEGCGVCVDFCPEQAISFPVKTCGEWFVSDTRFGPMVHARMGVGQENSGKLVALMRREAEKLAKERNAGLLITDGPPGIGCPVIASVGGATAVLIVAEPTVSGMHDMERVADLAGHFHVPVLVCVNKYDLNLDQAAAIEKTARGRNMTFVGRIPFDPAFIQSMVQGKTIIEYGGDLEISRAVRRVWDNILASPVMNR